MSRAMGDLIGHREAGITELADIMYVPTSKDMCGKGQGNPEYTEAEAAKDAGFNGGQNTFFKKHSHDCVAMIMASDGVWEFIDNDEAAKICCAQRDKDTGKIDPNRAAEALSKESWNRWMEDTNGEISDDITCMVQTL